MTTEELTTEINKLEREYLRKVEDLKLKWVEANKRFVKGEYIQNITGIIRVERIGYQEYPNGSLEIYYIGTPYKRLRGKILPSKSTEEKRLYGDTLKLVDRSQVVDCFRCRFYMDGRCYNYNDDSDGSKCKSKDYKDWKDCDNQRDYEYSTK